MEYYKLPISALELFAKKELPKSLKIEESIAENIQLILTTSFGEYAFDETFGCSLWDSDFENITSSDRWKEKLAKSIKKSVQLHEPRLSGINVTTAVVQDEIKTQMHGAEINRSKRRVNVEVTGTIDVTNQPFYVTTKLYVSPIALD